ncbi:MAG TPA: signal peptidase II [Pseudonocardiaceae bacterium]|nr:signal peptidase II [Pseudonocardiaceae bacterium]
MSTEPTSESGPEPSPSAVPAIAPPTRVLVLAAVAVIALGSDILTKALVVAHLEGGAPVRLLGGLVYFDVVRNSGAAFSMATGLTWILSLIALAVVVAIIWIAPRLRSVGWAIGLGLVLAGALGNLVDRIFRAPAPLQGHVVDFISVFGPNAEYFAIFNVADSCICVGGALIVLLAAFGRDYDGGIGRRDRNGGGSTSARDKSAADKTEADAAS